MRFAVSLFLILIALNSVTAQDIQYIADKDARIDTLIKSDAYQEAVLEIDSYLNFLHANGPLDSIYSQCYNAGRAYWKVKGIDEGIKKASEINKWVRENDPDTSHHLKTLNDMSWIYYETGNENKCIDVDSAHLNLCKAYSKVSPKTISTGYHNLGFYYVKMGDFKTAKEYFLSAVHVLDEMNAPEYKRRVQSLNAIGATLYSMGELRTAEKYYLQSLALTDSLEDDLAYSLKGSCYNNLMLTAWQQRNYLQAKRYSEEAIEAHNVTSRKAENPWDREVAMKHGLEVYTNLALLYETLGDYNMAYHLSNHVLGERSKFMSEDDPYLMGIRESMAGLKILMGDHSEFTIKEIMDYRDYCYEKYGKKSFYTSRAEINIAQLHEVKGEPEAAIVAYSRAIEYQASVSNRETDLDIADILEQRAFTYLSTGKLDSALNDLEEAGRIFTKSRGDDDPVVANNLLSKAELMYLKGDFKMALDLIDKADTMIYKRDLHWEESETIGELGLNPILKARSDFLSAKVRATSDKKLAKVKLNSAIDHLRHNKRAFSDHGAQLALYENHEKIFDLAQQFAFEMHTTEGSETEGLQEFFKYSEENKTILLKNRLQNFSALSYRDVPDSLLAKESDLLSYLESFGETESGLGELFEKEREFTALKSLFKSSYPEYYRLKYEDKNPSISDLQAKALDKDQTLLIYSVVDTIVYVMVIDRTHRNLIKLSAHGYTDELETMNRSLVTLDLENYLLSSHKLYLTLIAPIRDLINTSELLIIPDEDLYFLNFEVLTDEVATANDYLEKMLIQDWTISYLLSASTALKFEELRMNDNSETLSIAPGFTDELKSEYLADLRDSMELDQNYLKTLQQPFALRTAVNVAEMMSGSSYTGSSANEKKVKEDAKHYGIIHLGTHAEINLASPLLSRLVLSKDLNSGEDGYLHAYEIYEMPLHAELAVLSACETGLGRKQGSEGVMSLAHSFAYAGCPSIVMSLWGIDEQSSSNVIEEFYRNLSKGQAKNVALRNAKLSYINQKKDADQQFPFYWAGLVLVGDESPISIEQGFPLAGILIGAGLTLALVVFFLIRKKL